MSGNQRFKLTPRQERFCLLIVEGEGQSKAYEMAGYSVASPRIAAVNASQLMTKPNIQGRVAQLQAQAANRTVITVESLTADLIDIKNKALAAESFGPAVMAVQTIGKLNGLMVDRSESVVVHHRPAPLPTRVLELSEADWIRQFGQGLQERRLKQLEGISRRATKK